MILAELTDEKLRTDTRMRLVDDIPGFADLHSFEDIPDAGIRLEFTTKSDLRFTTDEPWQFKQSGAQDESLELILVDWTFGTEALSAHSECLWELEREPTVIMHTSEAQNLDLIDGDQVSIQTESGNLEAKLKVVENMAAGVLIVPRHREISWQIFKPGMTRIGREQIKKVGISQ